jgi:16S rRNA (guanine527-N7)-methyltransferase
LNQGTALAELRRRVPVEVEAALGRAAGLGFLGRAAVDDQIDHSLGFVAAIEQERPGEPESALDLGTGGGLPGLVLASCWPGSRVVLVDAGVRRSEFLSKELAEIPGPQAAEVRRGRAEELAHERDLRGRFQVVTARLFGSPAVTAECGSPFLAPGGLLVVSEPPRGLREDRWPTAGLAAMGLEPVVCAEVEARFGYQILRQVTPTPQRYPRRTGVPAKRPLF